MEFLPGQIILMSIGPCKWRTLLTCIVFKSGTIGDVSHQLNLFDPSAVKRFDCQNSDYTYSDWRFCCFVFQQLQDRNWFVQLFGTITNSQLFMFRSPRVSYLDLWTSFMINRIDLMNIFFSVERFLDREQSRHRRNWRISWFCSNASLYA